MKKSYTLGSAILLATLISGCMGTKHLSIGISDEGMVHYDDVVFPAVDKAWQKDGQFPNSENLGKIKPGISKDELYQLIGRPHFSEANKAREWDYILKFYQPDDSVKTCQYKVIFDKDYKGQEFYWLPADCANYAKPQTMVAPAPQIIYRDTPPAPAPIIIPAAPIISERINLSADALFHFDKFKVEDMLPRGKSELDLLAAKLREYQERGRVQVMITGHTDLLGDDMYNMNLSLLRAQTVRNYLITRGVAPDTITAMGAGESQPVKTCNTNVARAELISCLQPNRRVEVSVSVYAFE